MSTTHDTPLKLGCVTGVGIFLSTLDSGIINIALPRLLTVFDTQMATVIWTVTILR